MTQCDKIKHVKTTKSQNISQFCITTVTSTKAPRCVTDVAKPRLKALCLSTTPNIIFGATVKDTLSKADDIFNFQCPQSKTTKKHSQRPHLEQLDTLCLQGSIFNPAKLIVNLKIVRIFNLSAAAALFWSGGRIRTSSINQSSSQLPKYYPQCIEECE